MSTMIDSTVTPVTVEGPAAQDNEATLTERDSSDPAKTKLNRQPDRPSRADSIHDHDKVEIRSLNTKQESRHAITDSRSDTGEVDTEETSTTSTGSRLKERPAPGVCNSPSSKQETPANFHESDTEADNIYNHASQGRLVQDGVTKDAVPVNAPKVGSTEHSKQWEHQSHHSEEEKRHVLYKNEISSIPASTSTSDLNFSEAQPSHRNDGIEHKTAEEKEWDRSWFEDDITQYERGLSSTPAKHRPDKALQTPGQFHAVSIQESTAKPSTSVEALQSHSTTDVMVKVEVELIKKVESRSQEHTGEQLNRKEEVHNSKAGNTTVSSTHDAKVTSILLDKLLSNTQELRPGIAKNEIQDDQEEPLELLHFHDDLTQYDGILLWTAMFYRCYAQFQGPNQGVAIMSLQRLRRGKTNAKTEFNVLCGLSERAQAFCKHLQNFLGILENYQGDSLFKAPLNIVKPLLSFTSFETAQEQCLTCIQKGRRCAGFRQGKTRCIECHKDKLEDENTKEADECYWIHESWGILTYSDARDFFGYSDDKSKAQKRQATDEEADIQPRKHAKKAHSNRVVSSAAKRKTKSKCATLECFKTARGPFPVYLQHSRRLDHDLSPVPATIERRLFDAQGRQLTLSFNSRTGVNLSDFKSMRAAFEWSMWDYIKAKHKARLYAGRPDYNFKICRRMHGSEENLGEENFLHYDRQLAADRELTASEQMERRGRFVKPGVVFICEAKPRVQTP